MTFGDRIGLAPPPRITIPKPTIWHPGNLVAAEFPEPEGFLLGSIIARQSVALLAGWRGVGKTFIAMKYGACVAMNGAQLGHMSTRPGRVLFISQEMPEIPIRQRIRAVFTPAELDSMNPNFQLVCQYPGLRMDAAEGLVALKELLAETCPDLLIVDALRFIKGTAREKDNDEMGDVILRLIEAAIECNVAILLLHHMGKPREDGFESGRGASSIEDLCADVMYARKLEEPHRRRVRFDKLRYMGEVNPWAYSILKKETEDPDDQTVEILIEEGEDPGAHEDFELKKCVEAIRKAGGSMMQGVVKGEMQWSDTTMWRHKKRAENLGLIVVHKVKRQNEWCIPDDPQADVPF